ncbi:hypothetical protein Barb4_00274 [Bacteroidales bacterium Barb4]|nr:hypothetical protein Barb4_00274 [Bacteroidales bacterium Barb4]
MDNLSDWLYIVFLVIAGASSIFSSGKKKRRQAEAERQAEREITVDDSEYDYNPTPERDFWDVLQEMQEKIKPVPAIPPKIVTPLPIAESEGIRSIQKAAPVTFFQEESKETPLVSAEDFHDPEGLRKAVIYSEIFNRRY